MVSSRSDRRRTARHGTVLPRASWRQSPPQSRPIVPALARRILPRRRHAPPSSGFRRPAWDMKRILAARSPPMASKSSRRFSSSLMKTISGRAVMMRPLSGFLVPPTLSTPAAPAGAVQKRVTPTTRSPAPISNKVSVMFGTSDMIRRGIFRPPKHRPRSSREIIAWGYGDAGGYPAGRGVHRS